MSDRHDERLESMLRSRRFETPGADLAQRIIFAAQNREQNQTIPLMQRLARLFGEFHVPRPAYMLTATLLVGFVIGISSPVDLTPDTDSTGSQAFLVADEDVL